LHADNAQNVNCLPLIRVVDPFQGDIFLILEQAIEFGPESVESKLGQ
jgi:hypothetical protein